MKKQGELAATILGADFVEKLQKNSDVTLLKPASGLHIDANEIAIALNVVPRSVLGFLAANMRSMRIGDSKTIKLEPLIGINAAGHLSGSGAPSEHVLRLTKLDNDMYNGEIEGSGKILTTFRGKPLPGVGLVVMSTYEMYDGHAAEPAKQIAEQPPKEAAAVQHMINQEMVIKAGIISELTLQEILKLRIQTEMALSSLRAEIVSMAAHRLEISQAPTETTETESKLKRFLENREIKKKEANTFNIILAKGDSATCPDCRQNVLQDGTFNGCVCFGEDRNRKIFLKKTESGVQIKFAKGWDPENMEMLLEILKRRGK